DAGGGEYVLRRGPLGHSGGGAHDMGREYRVISALAGTPVPVPRAVARCDDERVTGATFYVMTRVDGVVVENAGIADAQLPGIASRRRAGEQIVDVMADMHRAD